MNHEVSPRAPRYGSGKRYGSGRRSAGVKADMKPTAEPGTPEAMTEPEPAVEARKGER
jgi:hypothetical protein